jgi:protein-S-isoprenylcysteine O-methyltransferase Ste14
MTRRAAALGSAIFFAVTPGTVAGVVPWSLTSWEVTHRYWLLLRIAGGVLIVCGGVILVRAFADFALRGVGTPAPVAPTQHLVVDGPYRYVRNPMYLAVLAAIIGQALLLGQPVLLVYAIVVAVAVGTFVVGYEEPTLAEQFGAEYDAYREAVPRWLPRLRPWDATEARMPTR